MRHRSTGHGVFVVWLLGMLLGATWMGCTCEPIYEDDADLDAEPDAPDEIDADVGEDADSGDASDGDADADEDLWVDADADEDEEAPDPYGPCPCPGEEECLTEGCPTCALPCISLADCPEPTSGTVTQECMPMGMGGDEMYCLLLCGGAGECPDGMVCDTEFEPVAACMTDC